METKVYQILDLEGLRKLLDKIEIQSKRGNREITFDPTDPMNRSLQGISVHVPQDGISPIRIAFFEKN